MAVGYLQDTSATIVPLGISCHAGSIDVIREHHGWVGVLIAFPLDNLCNTLWYLKTTPQG